MYLSKRLFPSAKITLQITHSDWSNLVTHTACIDPISTPHRLYIDPTSTSHRPHIDPTSTPYRHRVDPTSTPHRPCIDPTPTPHRLYIDLTWTQHWPHINPTSASHRPHIDPTSTPYHRRLFLAHHELTNENVSCFPISQSKTKTFIFLKKPVRPVKRVTHDHILMRFLRIYSWH